LGHQVFRGGLLVGQAAWLLGKSPPALDRRSPRVEKNEEKSGTAELRPCKGRHTKTPIATTNRREGKKKDWGAEHLSHAGELKQHAKKKGFDRRRLTEGERGQRDFVSYPGEPSQPPYPTKKTYEKANGPSHEKKAKLKAFCSQKKLQPRGGEGDFLGKLRSRRGKKWELASGTCANSGRGGSELQKRAK